MRRLLTLTVGLFLLSVSVWAAPKKPAAPPSKAKVKMMANLLKRCEDGVAVACHDYGKLLLQSRNKADKRRGTIYVRRACTLAYAPACQTRPTVADSKPVKDKSPKIDSHGRPCNNEELAKTAKLSSDGRQVAEVNRGSLWEQSGVKAGDTVVSVNGQPFSSSEQIGDALEKGGAVVNIVRDGREMSLMVNCP